MFWRKLRKFWKVLNDTAARNKWKKFKRDKIVEFLRYKILGKHLIRTYC